MGVFKATLQMGFSPICCWGGPQHPCLMQGAGMGGISLAWSLPLWVLVLVLPLPTALVSSLGFQKLRNES